MSLFDVLRYPISDIPTNDELLALPNDLFDRWVSKSDWDGRAVSKKHIVKWYQEYYGFTGPTGKMDTRDIEYLRTLIKEYEG